MPSEREQQEQLAFEIAEQVFNHAFRVLDKMPELDGEIAGQIAQAVQDLVERELLHVL